MQTLEVKIQEKDRPFWTELVRTHPLPPGVSVTFRTTASGKRDFTAEVASKGEKAFSKRYLVPTTDIWDFSNDRDSTGLKPQDLEPLEQIVLPKKALRVGGKSPSDPDYPYSETLFLTMKPAPAVDSALGRWWATLPGPSDHAVFLLGAVGDLLPTRGVEKILPGPDGLAKTFTDVLPLLQKMDYLMGNLEGPVTTRGAPQTALKYYVFQFLPSVLGPLKKAGFSYLTSANNHAFDHGKEGFEDTLRYVRENFDTSGAGLNLEEAARPLVKTVKGQTLAISALGAFPDEPTGFSGERHAAAGPHSPGILWKNPAGLAALQNSLKAQGFRIVFAHGGTEGALKPDADIQALYKSFIDNGADLVVACHPHVLQGFQVYKGKLIVYSLGDFMFPEMNDVPMANESILLRLGLYQGAIKYVETFPVEISNQTTFLSRRTDFMARTMQLTKELNP